MYGAQFCWNARWPLLWWVPTKCCVCLRNEVRKVPQLYRRSTWRSRGLLLRFFCRYVWVAELHEYTFYRSQKRIFAVGTDCGEMADRWVGAFSPRMESLQRVLPVVNLSFIGSTEQLKLAQVTGLKSRGCRFQIQSSIVQSNEESIYGEPLRHSLKSSIYMQRNWNRKKLHGTFKCDSPFYWWFWNPWLVQEEFPVPLLEVPLHVWFSPLSRQTLLNMQLPEVPTSFETRESGEISNQGNLKEIYSVASFEH